MSPILYVGYGFLSFALLTYCASFLGLLLSYKAFLRNRNLYKKFNVRHLSQSKNAFLVLLLSLSLLVTGKASVSKQSIAIKIPDKIFNLTSILKPNLIESGKGQTLDIGIAQLQSELEKMGISDKNVGQQIATTNNNLPAQLTSSILKQTSNPINTIIESQMNVMKASIETQLNNILSPFLPYLPYIMGVLFFLQFIFFSIFFTFISDILFLVFIKIFLATNIIAIRKRPEEVEYLEV